MILYADISRSASLRVCRARRRKTCQRENDSATGDIFRVTEEQFTRAALDPIIRLFRDSLSLSLSLSFSLRHSVHSPRHVLFPREIATKA